MKTAAFLISAALLGAAKASIITPVISGVSTQFHAQDTLGQFSYSYSNLHSAKTETRSLDGVTKGGFSYVDPLGKIQTVQYSADDLSGFRVLAASNLPVAPILPPFVQLKQIPDTKEVAEAKAKHLALLEEAKNLTAEAEKLENSSGKNSSVVTGVNVSVIHTEIPGAVVNQQVQLLPALRGVFPTLPALELPALKSIPAPAVKSATDDDNNNDKKEKVTEHSDAKKEDKPLEALPIHTLPVFPTLWASPLTYGYSIVTHPAVTTYTAPVLLPSFQGIDPFGLLASPYAALNLTSPTSSTTTTTTTTEKTTETAEK